MHQSGPRTLKGLLNCSMSLVFTFLSVTNHTKALTLDVALDFHKKLVGIRGLNLEKRIRLKKNNFTEKTPEEDGTQDLESRIGDKWKLDSDDINLS